MNLFMVILHQPQRHYVRNAFIKVFLKVTVLNPLESKVNSLEQRMIITLDPYIFPTCFGAKDTTQSPLFFFQNIALLDFFLHC